MELTDKQKEKLKSFQVDFLIENKHEFFGYRFYLERRDLHEDIINADPRFNDIAIPIVVEGYSVLLPFASQESRSFQVTSHFFNTERTVLTVFFQWPLGEGEETLHFMAVCLKFDEQDSLYVATICHELYPHNRALRELGFFPKKDDKNG